MFYGLNYRNFEIENTDVLRQQADSDFSVSGGENQPLGLKNEFVDDDSGWAFWPKFELFLEKLWITIESKINLVL